MEARPAAAHDVARCAACQAGRVRWAFNLRAWAPWDHEWLFLQDLLPEDDQKTVRPAGSGASRPGARPGQAWRASVLSRRAVQVQGYRFEDDRKRALLSRMMQRQAVQAATGLSWSKMRIARTKGNKPYLANKPQTSCLPNYNFNVSHEVRTNQHSVWRLSILVLWFRASGVTVHP